MQQNLDDLSLPPRSNDSIHPLSEIEDTSPDYESPTEISEAVLSRVERENGDIIWFDRVADETSCSVGVEGYHEEECLGDQALTRTHRCILTYEVVGVPESFKTLFTDRMVGGSVHQEHNEQHPTRQYQHTTCANNVRMTSDTSSLSIMNLHRSLFANLRPLDLPISLYP
jgi:hypothetical protein